MGDTNSEPIAVVGIGGVFPGRWADRGLAGFWDDIRDGRDVSREPPEGRWVFDLARAHDPQRGKPDHVYSRRACFVEDFEISDAKVAACAHGLDPVVAIALEAGTHAWSQAATDDLDPDRVGVILANIALPNDAHANMADWVLGRRFRRELFAQLGQPVPGCGEQPADPIHRHVIGLPASVLARALGLGGTHYGLDAACASSLFSIELAALELRSGRLDAVLCGGVSRADGLYTQMGFSQLGALSARGRCAPFDHRADGIVVGEGGGVVVLKRLSRALSDGDRVRALLPACGLSNDVDGRLLAPSEEGQLRAMRGAYRRAGWDPASVDLVECHATGTPVGDAVEYRSLRTLRGGGSHNGRKTVIGSVKSNVGHLLTGAGAAGLIKVLLALQHRVLPPSANFERPSSGLDFADGPFEVLTSAKEWEGGGTPRRAAVSGFGFGGTNAHLLVEEYVGQSAGASAKPVVAVPRRRPLDLAIVGMGGRAGSWSSLETLAARLLGRGSDADGLGPKKEDWGFEDDRPGFFIEHVEVVPGRYRIPPKELVDALPQQSIMLDVAAEAVNDARGEAADPLRTGVFVGISLDQNTTNFSLRWRLRQWAPSWARELGLADRGPEFDAWLEELCDRASVALSPDRTMGGLGAIAASRIAREFGFGGPAFVVSSGENASLVGLDAAARALQTGDIDAALVGAIELGADPRARYATDLLRSESASGRAMPFDLDADGIVLGEGAVALLLRRADDAERDGERVYARIRGLGTATSGRARATVPTSRGYERSLRLALDEAGVAEADLGYLEAHGSGSATEDRIEAESLEGLHRGQPRCVLGSAKADVGHTGAASALMGVLKASLCLHHRIVPRLRGTTCPRPQLAGFELPAASRPWLRDASEPKRHALVGAMSATGHSGHVVLAEAEPEDAAYAPLPGPTRHGLFVLEADADEGLGALLERLGEWAAERRTAPISRVAADWADACPRKPSARFGLAIVCETVAELRELIGRARDGRKAGRPLSDFAAGRLFHQRAPLGADAQIAFVYPGSGAQFAGMGRDFALAWPQVLRDLEGVSETVRSQFLPEQAWGTRRDLARADARDLILSQVALGTLMTDVLRQFVGAPRAVLGYSLGETAGLFANGAWSQRDEMVARVAASPLFTTELTGPCNAARRRWGLTNGRSHESIVWRLGVVDRPAAEVRDALEGIERAYLLIVNTPGECVIGGDGPAVDAVVARLRSSFHPLEGVTTVHCEVAEEVRKAYRDLHLLETSAPPGIRFYSGHAGRAYAVTRDAAADSILAQALHGLDFPRVVNAAYDDGVRIFIELGPGGSCTRMINKTLAAREDADRVVSRALCVAGQDGPTALIRTLASLVAERVPVNLEPLHRRARSSEPTRLGAMAVRVGGDPRWPRMAGLPWPPAATELPSEAMHPVAATSVHVGGGVETHSASPRIQARGTISQSVTEIRTRVDRPEAARPFLDREGCLRFAVGQIGEVLGSRFAHVDEYPTRVRLPDEPLMLVDRIVEVEGEPQSMQPGRVVTEHDVLEDGWYLDGGRIPTCVAVEAGQADLFLSAYLGIDSETRGLAVYRLLDATVTFHDRLPRPGQVIRYDIHIDQFSFHGRNWLFRFHFDATVDGRPLMSMREGCAGFFSERDLEAGQGIVKSRLDRAPIPGKRPDDWRALVPMERGQTLDEADVEALVRGDLARAFGPGFAGLGLDDPLTLPDGHMRLVHRVVDIDPEGGRFGIGRIVAEADIHPDDWFITCHFVDDRVMPGTLMYECCLHTLRVFLMRQGWVGERGEVVCEPVVGVTSRLKCRGQVLETTRVVTYDIEIKEMGYRDGEVPYAIVDATMLADGKPIVDIRDMSLQMNGCRRSGLETMWSTRTRTPPRGHIGGRSAAAGPGPRAAVYDSARIREFSEGSPSSAFGDEYAVFDEQRRIARLPRAPFAFLDRITRVDGRAFELRAGAKCEAQFDVRPEHWYFDDNRQREMPFSVLLEVGLQPCGWLAAYCGSALASSTDLKFRNLGGRAIQRAPVVREHDTLTTQVELKNVAQSGGMIIQDYAFSMVSERRGPIYEGTTNFGFFSVQALASQVGLRGDPLAEFDPGRPSRAPFDVPTSAPFPSRRMWMVDRIERLELDGGTRGLGFVEGVSGVDPSAWFFAAHFFQDPVWPGSLGIEAFLQLLKTLAAERWGPAPKVEDLFSCVVAGHGHEWQYRGQVVPTCNEVRVRASVTEIDEPGRTLIADGVLIVDGLPIYSLKNFALRHGSGDGRRR